MTQLPMQARCPHVWAHPAPIGRAHGEHQNPRELLLNMIALLDKVSPYPVSKMHLR